MNEGSTNALLRAGVGLAFIRQDEANVMLEAGEIVVWAGESFFLPLQVAYLKSRIEDPVVKAILAVSCINVIVLDLLRWINMII